MACIALSLAIKELVSMLFVRGQCCTPGKIGVQLPRERIPGRGTLICRDRKSELIVHSVGAGAVLGTQAELWSHAAGAHGSGTNLLRIGGPLDGLDCGTPHRYKQR